MAKLNEKNERTKKVIHLMTTTLCSRDCPYCCNKQYDIDQVPTVTDEELKECEVVCLTGGEPVRFSNVKAIAARLKTKNRHIKVYVYANAMELYFYLKTDKNWMGRRLIDGWSVSIKHGEDARLFKKLVELFPKDFLNKSNRLYVYDNLFPKEDCPDCFEYFDREWQEDFKPADDSIFRRI